MIKKLKSFLDKKINVNFDHLSKISKKYSKNKNFIIFATIILTLLFSYIGYLEYKDYQHKQILKKEEKVIIEKRNNEIAAETCQKSSEENGYQSQYTFSFSPEKYYVSDKLEIEKLLFLENNIDKIKKTYNIKDEFINLNYSKSLRKFVYLSQPTEGYFEDEVLKEVKVFDIQNNNFKTIFSMRNKVVDNQSDIRDVIELRSISLSDDQKNLLIITDSELFIYDLESGEFINSYNPKFNPEEANETAFIKALNPDRHYFQGGKFVPNSDNIILTQVYWDSGQEFLYNFKTKELKSLKISSGSGWSGNALINFTKNNIFFWENISDGYTICKDNFNRNSKTCIKNPPIFDSPNRTGILIGDKLYYSINEYDKNNKFSVCNPLNQLREWNYHYLNLLEINTNNMTSKSIMKINNSPKIAIYNGTFPGSEMNFGILSKYNLNGIEGLLLKISIKEENILAFFNPQDPDKLIKIEIIEN